MEPVIEGLIKLFNDNNLRPVQLAALAALTNTLVQTYCTNAYELYIYGKRLSTAFSITHRKFICMTNDKLQQMTPDDLEFSTTLDIIERNLAAEDATLETGEAAPPMQDTAIPTFKL